MAGSISRDNKSYEHFSDGVGSKNSPMSAIDKKIVNFAAKLKDQPVTKTHGQILRNFGMLPPEFWMRAQNLSSHPDVDPEHRDRMSQMFPDPSRPGPMAGGTPVDTESTKFSHGLTW